MNSVASMLAAMFSAAVVDQGALIPTLVSSLQQQTEAVVRFDQTNWAECVKQEIYELSKFKRTERNEKIMDNIVYIVDRQLDASMFPTGIIADYELYTFKQEVAGFLSGMFLFNVNDFLEDVPCGDSLIQKHLSIEKYEEENSILKQRFDAFFTKYRAKMLEYKSQGFGNVEELHRMDMFQGAQKRLSVIGDDIVRIINDFGQFVQQMKLALPDSAAAASIGTVSNTSIARALKPLEGWAKAAKMKHLKEVPYKRLYLEQLWDLVYYMVHEHFAQCPKMKDNEKADILNQQFNKLYVVFEGIRSSSEESLSLPNALPYIDECLNAEILKAQHIPLPSGYITFLKRDGAFFGMNYNMTPVTDILFRNIECSVFRIPEEISRKKAEASRQQIEAVRKVAVSRDEARRSLVGNWDALLNMEQAAWDQLIVKLSEKYQMPDLLIDSSENSIAARRKYQALALARHLEIKRLHKEKVDAFEQGLDDRNAALCDASVRTMKSEYDECVHAIMSERIQVFQDAMRVQARRVAEEKTRMFRNFESEMLQQRQEAESAEQERVLQQQQQEQARAQQQQEAEKQSRYKNFAEQMFKDKSQRFGLNLTSRLQTHDCVTSSVKHDDVEVYGAAAACSQQSSVVFVKAKKSTLQESVDLGSAHRATVVPVVVAAVASTQSNVVAQRKQKPAKLPLPTAGLVKQNIQQGSAIEEFCEPTNSSLSSVSTAGIAVSTVNREAPVVSTVQKMKRHCHNPYKAKGCGCCAQRGNTQEGALPAFLRASLEQNSHRSDQGSQCEYEQQEYFDDVHSYDALESGYDGHGQQYLTDVYGNSYIMDHSGSLAPYYQQQSAAFAPAAYAASFDQYFLWQQQALMSSSYGLPSYDATVGSLHQQQVIPTVKHKKRYQERY